MLCPVNFFVGFLLNHVLEKKNNILCCKRDKMAIENFRRVDVVYMTEKSST